MLQAAGLTIRLSPAGDVVIARADAPEGTLLVKEGNGRVGREVEDRAVGLRRGRVRTADARRNHVSRAALRAAVVAMVAASSATAQVVVPRPPIQRPAPVLVVPGTVTVTPLEYWGAIAYHRPTGAHGYSYDFPSSREAGVAALEACGNPECIVVASYKGGCGLLMDGPTGTSFAEGVTAREAETKARLKCTDPQCQVIAWSCTR